MADELISGDDELSDWAKARGSDFFLRPDSTVVSSLQTVSRWANEQSFDIAAVSTFLQVADHYLVAQAHADAHVVVTHEVVTDTRKKIKIPNACIGVDIKCVTPFEMLRLEGARFVLGKTPSAEVA